MFEGFFIGVLDDDKEWIEVIKDNGRKTQAYLKFTKFHIDTIFAPESFEGIRVFCDMSLIEGVMDKFSATFIKFGDNDNVIVLEDNGHLQDVPVSCITIKLGEKIKKVII